MVQEPEQEFWFICPMCQAVGFIDEDQAEGRVSIMHDPASASGACGYHETGKVQPKIPASQPLLSDQRPQIIHPSDT